MNKTSLTKESIQLGALLTVSEVWFIIILVGIITHDPGAVTENYILIHRPGEKSWSLYYVISSEFTAYIICGRGVTLF